MGRRRKSGTPGKSALSSGFSPLHVIESPVRALQPTVCGWGDENPPEWRKIFQPGFIPFRCAGFRFAGFARTSDFQADRHSGRSARRCRRNGFFDLTRGLFEVRLFLTASARGEPESRLWRVFANGARRNVRVPNFWKAGVRFPTHRRSCLVKMPELAVRRFSPPSAAAPPGLERKPGLRLSARSFKCDAAGFQRTLAHEGNCRPTRETRAPAGMTRHGNARVKKTERRPAHSVIP